MLDLGVLTHTPWPLLTGMGADTKQAGPTCFPKQPSTTLDNPVLQSLPSEALASMVLNPSGKNTGCSQDCRPGPPREPGENPQPLQPCVASGPLEREQQCSRCSTRVPGSKEPPGTQRRDKEEKTKPWLRKLEAGAAGMPHAQGVPVRPCSYTSTVPCPGRAGPRHPVPVGSQAPVGHWGQAHEKGISLMSTG